MASQGKPPALESVFEWDDFEAEFGLVAPQATGTRATLKSARRLPSTVEYGPLTQPGRSKGGSRDGQLGGLESIGHDDLVEQVGNYSDPLDLDLLQLLSEIDQAGEQSENTSIQHGERTKEARDRELEALWRRKTRHIPDQLSKIFERVRVPDYRLIALETFESRFFGWSERTRCNGEGSVLDAASVRIAYNRLCRGPDASKALLLAGRIVDSELRTRHQLALEEPSSDAGLRLSGVARGPLRVRDTGYRKPSIGLRSFLEVTPIEVVAHALQVIDTRVATSQSN